MWIWLNISMRSCNHGVSLIMAYKKIYYFLEVLIIDRGSALKTFDSDMLNITLWYLLCFVLSANTFWFQWYLAYLRSPVGLNCSFRYKDSLCSVDDVTTNFENRKQLDPLGFVAVYSPLFSRLFLRTKRHSGTSATLLWCLVSFRRKNDFDFQYENSIINDLSYSQKIGPFFLSRLYLKHWCRIWPIIFQWETLFVTLPWKGFFSEPIEIEKSTECNLNVFWKYKQRSKTSTTYSYFFHFGRVNCVINVFTLTIEWLPLWTNHETRKFNTSNHDAWTVKMTLSVYSNIITVTLKWLPYFELSDWLV